MDYLEKQEPLGKLAIMEIEERQEQMVSLASKVFKDPQVQLGQLDLLETRVFR